MHGVSEKPKAPDIIETRAPARLDRLPWGRFHTLVIAALGITWVLDGLEVTLAGSVAGALKASPVLRFTDFGCGARVEPLPRGRGERGTDLRLDGRLAWPPPACSSSR